MTTTVSPQQQYNLGAAEWGRHRLDFGIGMDLSYWCGVGAVPSATASPLSFFFVFVFPLSCLWSGREKGVFFEVRHSARFLFIPFPNYLKT